MTGDLVSTGLHLGNILTRILLESGPLPTDYKGSFFILRLLSLFHRLMSLLLILGLGHLAGG